MRKSILIFVFIFVILVFSYSKIGILVQKQKADTYIDTIKGFKEVLLKKGLKNSDFVEKNANNKPEIMKQIANDFNNDGQIKMIIVLGSTATTIVNEIVKEKPVVFAGINHPDALGISGNNITGSTYYIKPKSMISGIKQILPQVTKIGFLYEADNKATKVVLPETEKACNDFKIKLFKGPVLKEDEIKAKVLELLKNNVDIILIPTQNKLYNNVALIRTLTDPKKVPVVSFPKVGVQNGALFGISSNNNLLGKALAQIIYKIYKEGSSPGDLPFQFPEKYFFFINQTTSKDLNIAIPYKILKVATIIK